MTRRKNTSAPGLILFAHGSRNAAWRKPFDKLLKDVAKQSGVPTALAFGEFMPPTLSEAAQQLATKGVTRAVVVPLFLGGGAHVRGDTPRLAREATDASSIKLKIAKTVGEEAGVLAAMARYCVAQSRAANVNKKLNKIK